MAIDVPENNDNAPAPPAGGGPVPFGARPAYQAFRALVATWVPQGVDFGPVGRLLVHSLDAHMVGVAFRRSPEDDDPVLCLTLCFRDPECRWTPELGAHLGTAFAEEVSARGQRADVNVELAISLEEDPGPEAEAEVDFNREVDYPVAGDLAVAVVRLSQ